MTATELISRVTLLGLSVLAPAAAAAGWVGGASGAAGVAAGGGLALLNFRWLARGIAASGRGRRLRAWSALTSALRYAGTFAALALALSTGWADPLGVLVGLSVLPPVLIVQGLRSAG